MKQRFLIILSFILYSTIGLGQQRIQFSQYMVNQYVLNPAVGGIGTDLDVTMSYRKQWVNLQGGPETYYVTGHMPFGKKELKPGEKRSSSFHSAGFAAFNDVTGPIGKTTFFGSYSYNMPLFGDYRLAAGVFAGVTDIRLDQGMLEFDQPGEVVNYPRISMPDGSLGLWFYDDRWFAGTSLNQIFYNTTGFIEQSGHLVYHYYLTSGVKIPLGGQKDGRGGATTFLVPSAMLKYGGWGTPPSIDLNVKFHFLENFWVGTSYRHRDSQVILAGLSYQSRYVGLFQVSYAYDYTLSGINPHTSGSHEIIIGYQFYKPEEICPKKFW